MMAVRTARSRGLRRSSGIFPALDRSWHEGETISAHCGPNLGIFLLSAFSFSTYYGKWIEQSSLIVWRFDRPCQGSSDGQVIAIDGLGLRFMFRFDGRRTGIRCSKVADGGRWLCTPLAQQFALVFF
jgi:hypothetical protein